jgi:3-oxoacyl-[acyl-carrier-protein] synthase III
MDFHFKNKKITGILSILPSRDIYFDDELMYYNFSGLKAEKLKLTMGYNKRRIFDKGLCVSDICVKGMEHLFSSGKLNKEDIDAMILVTQSPDYFLPPTCNLIQGRLGLGSGVICMDIVQGCAGYILGLIQAFMLLEQKNIKKVVILNADILSRKVSRYDRQISPMLGDACSITIVEDSEVPCDILCNYNVDGGRAMSVNIPAGGWREPSTDQTAVLEEDKNGNRRSLNDMVEDGSQIFNLIQLNVPEMIKHILEITGISKEQIDYYIVHQPNRFMIQKLADKIGVLRDKMPSNIVENFGNSSGVTLPVNIVHNLGSILISEKKKILLSGFGVGLAWGATILDMENLDFCEVFEVSGEEQ